MSLLRLSTFGPSVVFCISCTQDAFFLKEKMSRSYKLDEFQIECIEHFCVDMLEFPDYIPIEAVVCLVIGSSE